VSLPTKQTEKNEELCEIKYCPRSHSMPVA